MISADKPNVDWPLILGSLSAVVLFLTSVIVIAVVLHRKGILPEDLSSLTERDNHHNLLFNVKKVISCSLPHFSFSKSNSQGEE